MASERRRRRKKLCMFSLGGFRKKVKAAIWKLAVSCLISVRVQSTARTLPDYSRVSFCDASFYDDSLLRPLSSRTEHSRLVVHHCRNSSVISLLIALLVLFRCACVSSFLLFWCGSFKLIVNFPPRRPSKRHKRRKNQNS